MGGRGSKSSRNSFTRDGGGGAREAGPNPEPKEALPARDQASAESLRFEMYDLGKDAEGSAMAAYKTNSLSTAKAEISYAKSYLKDHEAKMADIKRRFNPTKASLSDMTADTKRAKTLLQRAEAKMAAGKYTKP